MSMASSFLITLRGMHLCFRIPYLIGYRTKINWKPGKNLTVKITKQTKGPRGGRGGRRGGGGGAARVTTVEEPCESFFRFFEPPQPPTGEDEDDEEEVWFVILCTYTSFCYCNQDILMVTGKSWFPESQLAFVSFVFYDPNM